MSSAVINADKTIDTETKRKRIIKINIFALWLFCALKAPTVGIDIAGYKRIYEESARWPWMAFSNVYFEAGYTLLMQLFSKVGLSFQIFNGFVYIVIYFPWYVFLSRYSKEPTISILIYICYQFWVFNMSGLRQGMAMSICLLAFMLLEKKKAKRILGFIGLVVLASTLHQSAIIFFIALGVYYFTVSIKTIVGFLGVCFGAIFFRSSVVTLVNSIAGKYQVQQNMTLGGSFIMLIGFAAFSFGILAICQYRNGLFRGFEIDQAATYMMLCSIVLNLFLNGSNILRAASYASMFLTIALPNCINRCTRTSRLIVNVAVGLFLISLYFSDVLLVNQLNILPYRFFWSN